MLDVIVELHDRLKPAKTLISGPRIADVGLVGATLFERTCVPVTMLASPVTNVAYSILPGESKDVLRLVQYSELRKEPFIASFPNKIGATGFKKSIYNEAYHAYIRNVVSAFPGGLSSHPKFIVNLLPKLPIKD